MSIYSLHIGAYIHIYIYIHIYKHTYTLVDICTSTGLRNYIWLTKTIYNYYTVIYERKHGHKFGKC